MRVTDFASGNSKSAYKTELWEEDKNMFPWQKIIVYRSKDRADWEEAKRLLEESGIGNYPLAADETPVAGCGAKIDPRKFLNEKSVPTTVYSIEVAKEDRERAEKILDGKVQPPRSYGYGV